MVHHTRQSRAASVPMPESVPGLLAQPAESRLRISLRRFNLAGLTHRDWRRGWLPRLSQMLRLARFLVVGASGLLVNSLCLALAAGVAGQHYLVGAALATQCSTVWNFCWTERWVFAADRAGGHWIKRFLKFVLMNNLALALREPLLWGLTSRLGVHYLLSNLISLLLLTAIRYTLACAWIWAGRPSGQVPAPSPGRDIFP